MENREIANITKIAKAGMWLGEDGIVRIVWVPGAAVTLAATAEVELLRLTAAILAALPEALETVRAARVEHAELGGGIA